MEKLLLLGVGALARAVRAQLPDTAAMGTTRKQPDARFTTVGPVALGDAQALRAAAGGAWVVASFPPDGAADRELARHVTDARSIVYVSSTAVYPSSMDPITELSATSATEERAVLRLQAEQTWLAIGASILRLPAFYGPEGGLHVSLARGTFRMPGFGHNLVSRVHVDDAARFVIAGLTAARGSLLLGGDQEPAPVSEVVQFVCQLFQLPTPAISEGEAVPLSLRQSRRIDSSGTRAHYDLRLAYPSYREGYRAVHAAGTAGMSAS